jgi:glycosyltransferase involved in cell wall biosynthesis
VVPAELSVIICSLNGAPGVDRCLRALAAQTIFPSLEVIVVDDGSADATSETGRAHGAVVIRHRVNRGLAAARNSGLSAATAPVVAFLDDDCEPEPAWAQQLLSGYREGVTGVGGLVLPVTSSRFMLGYLRRNNPMNPQELNLAESGRLLYRLKLYLQRQWAQQEDLSSRAVYAFAGANMSFSREALAVAGPFDERFRFGGEDLDMCMRLARSVPDGRLVFRPQALVIHHFEPSVQDTLRRSRAYGRGSARLYRKWASMPPTIFPGPLLVLAMLTLSRRHTWLTGAAIAAPQLLYPSGLRHAWSTRSGASLLDAYVQLGQEAGANVGFFEGLWLFRHLVPEPGAKAAEATGPQDEAGALI